MCGVLSAPVTRAFGLVRGIGACRIAQAAARALLANERKAGLVPRAVDDERKTQRFASARGIERVDLDVVTRKRTAAFADLRHDAGSVAEIEHRHSEHLPVSVARMRVVGVLDRDGPAVAEAILDLCANLRIAQVRQKRERALREFHRSLLQATVAVGT